MLNIFSRCTCFFKALCLIFILLAVEVKGGQSFSIFIIFSAEFIISHTQLVLWLLCWEHNTLQKISEIAQGHTKSVQTTRPSEISSGHQPHWHSETKYFMTSSWNLSLLPCQIGSRDMKLLRCSCLDRVDTFLCHMYNLCTLKTVVLNDYLDMLEWLSFPLCSMFSCFFRNFLENLTLLLK